MDFDQDRIYYSHQNLQQRQQNQHQSGEEGYDAANAAAAYNDDDDIDIDGEPNLGAVRRHFREFLRNYRQGPNRFVYRERLLRMYRRASSTATWGAGWDGNDDGGADSVAKYNVHCNEFDVAGGGGGGAIEVDLAHVGEYDAALLDLLLSRPAHVLPPFEAAAADALKTLLRDMRTATATATSTRPEDSGRNNHRDDERGDGGDDGDGGDNDANREYRRMNPSAELQLADFPESAIQIVLRGNMKCTDLRQITAGHMNRLIQCPGIVIQSSRVRSRASSIHIRCSRCPSTMTLHSPHPFGGVALPARCRGADPESCGRTPYEIIPEGCVFVDQQTLKLQERPEYVPTGEMPRSLLLAAERNLVDLAPPGTRVSVIGIASLFSSASSSSGGRGGSNRSGVKTVYLRVVGMQRDDSTSTAGAAATSSSAAYFTPREEEAFRTLARRPDIYSILYRSIAPSISGSYTVNIKKALVCQLFGGSSKRLPDGMKLRGDINVLLLGDPSMAKSQFLKFVHRVAPVGVYTSGKGSSAAGLTASVVRDTRGEFYLEGGAMVLADGGIVCIDEFDKMRPADRVAIHEAMEQQTISVAKAGITTVLNSRTSVLAAANPVYGRYDDLKTAGENIDLMTTILSRFDLIFLVRDMRDEDRDRAICRHVMGVHINSRHDSSTATRVATRPDGFHDAHEIGANGPVMTTANDDGIGGGGGAEEVAENAARVATSGEGELDVATMKKYVQYCRARCSPRLSDEAVDVLSSSYVKIRDDVRKKGMEMASAGGRNAAAMDVSSQVVIPITVRQLEALVRLSESLAKMRLSSEVHAQDVAEALRLFQVSTMAANSAGLDRSNIGSTTGGGILGASREDFLRVESFLHSRLVIGAMVNKQRIIEEAASQGYDAMIVARVIGVMALRGEVQERNQSRLIKRIK